MEGFGRDDDDDDTCGEGWRSDDTAATPPRPCCCSPLGARRDSRGLSNVPLLKNDPSEANAVAAAPDDEGEGDEDTCCCGLKALDGVPEGLERASLSLSMILTVDALRMMVALTELYV